MFLKKNIVQIQDIVIFKWQNTWFFNYFLIVDFCPSFFYNKIIQKIIICQLKLAWQRRKMNWNEIAVVCYPFFKSYHVNFSCFLMHENSLTYRLICVCVCFKKFKHTLLYKEDFTYLQWSGGSSDKSSTGGSNIFGCEFGSACWEIVYGRHNHVIILVSGYVGVF